MATGPHPLHPLVVLSILWSQSSQLSAPHSAVADASRAHLRESTTYYATLSCHCLPASGGDSGVCNTTYDRPPSAGVPQH